ncbi:YlbF family regulator [Cytobacillus gottheilii]|uniref:YlbF family regulator n=1 Tax=Cytobacillus gottheilii TaxID=859144 RepID=A0ABX8FGL5_9BACI|nr:YlbF family regulator [Cytobacillus gottheilii]QVY63165.1 YlbF family regulator [Cytobacillus gottheilii]
MLATLETLEILDASDELSLMVIQSEAAEEYRTRLNIMKNSKESQRKIAAFVELKELYEEVQRFGKYHPEYKRVMMTIREVKRDMDMDENVAQFRLAENQLQNLLDEIGMLIGKSVSQSVKVPTGSPYFSSSSCGGGCGSGGSCGCSA